MLVHLSEDFVCSSFSALLEKNPARIAPDMLCQTLNMAPGTVAIASEGNEVDAMEVARPEFCIPTSIASVLLLVLSIPARMEAP